MPDDQGNEVGHIICDAFGQIVENILPLTLTGSGIQPLSTTFIVDSQVVTSSPGVTKYYMFGSVGYGLWGLYGIMSPKMDLIYLKWCETW